MRILLVLSAVLAFTSITFAGGGSPARYFADTGATDTSTGTDTGAGTDTGEPRSPAPAGAATPVAGSP